MFQVFATIFFSASVLLALGVIVGMVSENITDIRKALGLQSPEAVATSRRRGRQAVRSASVRPRAVIAPQRRAAA